MLSKDHFKQGEVMGKYRKSTATAAKSVSHISQTRSLVARGMQTIPARLVPPPRGRSEKGRRRGDGLLMVLYMNKSAS